MEQGEEIQSKRGRILAVALGLLAERGFHGAPISAIAKEAEIGVGTIYRYFKDKDSLIHEIFRELHSRYHQQVMTRFDPGRPLPERFHQIFDLLLRLFLAAPSEFRFMELYYYSPYATATAARLPAEEGVIFKTLQEAQAKGLCKDVPMQVLEALAWGPVVALAKEHSNRHLAVNDEIIAQTVQASWDAIRRCETRQAPHHRTTPDQPVKSGKKDAKQKQAAINHGQVLGTNDPRGNAPDPGSGLRQGRTR